MATRPRRKLPLDRHDEWATTFHSSAALISVKSGSKTPRIGNISTEGATCSVAACFLASTNAVSILPVWQ